MNLTLERLNQIEFKLKIANLAAVLMQFLICVVLRFYNGPFRVEFCLALCYRVFQSCLAL